MELIKSVRVRQNDIKSGSIDIKVSLYENKRTFGADEIILAGINNGYPVWSQLTYKKSGLYKDFTNDDFIKDFINVRSKLDNKEYKIIQDPWQETVPLWRDYGYDPYYLNNGSSITITWKNSEGKQIGGKQFSTDRGEEILISDIIPDDIIKTVDIKGANGELIVLSKNETLELKDKSEAKPFGRNKDLDIIKIVIQAWKKKAPNYESLDLCKPNNESCNLLEYKSPIDRPITESTSETLQDKIAINEKPKEPIKVVLPTDAIKAKVDTSLKIYIGKPTEMLENTNTEVDEFEGLSPEYIEGTFEGQDETQWAPLPGAADDVFDPDTDKGGDDTFQPESFVPATKTQRDFIKTAVRATLSRGEKHGKCARYTFNHVNNYVRLLQGKSVQQGDVYAAGGNANQPGYHKNLESMGYKKLDKGTISKSSIIQQIESPNWEVGDVITYWCIDGPSGSSHVKYGHTQIFTNGYHNDSKYRWSTDNMNNYNSAFVYRNKPGNSYRFIIFKAPKTNRISDVA